MPRVKRGKSHVKRRKSLLSKTKGYRTNRRKTVRLAKTAVLKAGAYAYRDRRNKKRAARRLNQVQINAAARLENISYSKLIDALKKKKIILDRKVLAELAQDHHAVFKKIVASIK
jgi:large subunit ribosomal protein L20